MDKRRKQDQLDFWLEKVWVECNAVCYYRALGRCVDQKLISTEVQTCTKTPRNTDQDNHIVNATSPV